MYESYFSSGLYVQGVYLVEMTDFLSQSVDLSRALFYLFKIVIVTSSEWKFKLNNFFKGLLLNWGGLGNYVFQFGAFITICLFYHKFSIFNYTLISL